MHEFDFIARYLAPLAGTEALGLKDDAAIIPGPAGLEYVLTKDVLVEGVHFLPESDPFLLAQKALAVNLSDLAAMGATPRFYLSGATLTHKQDEAWLKRFTEGLKASQERYNFTLLGGDTTRHEGPLMLSITMIGEVPVGQALRRSGAKVGDAVYVSGTIGLAADFTHPRYLNPEPRLALGQKLRGIAHAAVDVSDGLVADLEHIAHASGVRIVLEGGVIPIAPGLALEKAITAGDDYELAFCAPAEVAEKLGATRIGHVEGGSGIVVLGPEGHPLTLTKKGYTHF